MADTHSKEQRTKNMQAIKSRSKLEDKVSKALWMKGYRFRKNTKLFGKPDISIQKFKIVIFIDSCFWHVCPMHSNSPKSNQEYWIKKLNRNQERDREVNQFYISNKWNLLRIWEHDLKKDFNGSIETISKFIDNIKSNR
ncbi:very short patch repair endonuclease [Mesobacillus sp. LC4]